MNQSDEWSDREEVEGKNKWMVAIEKRNKLFITKPVYYHYCHFDREGLILLII